MKENRLALEKSPYLLQHKNNPVNWYPWGDEAFKKAKDEDKPVFLSIGYSTCHWCHVMEHESFEDEEVASLMNRDFVSIKVDREERPDIDAVYMSVCQMITGSGGWPLTVFLTPAKEPFFAGTYFAKHERFGRIGMMELLPRIAELWKEQKDKIKLSAAEIVEALKKENLSAGNEEPDKLIFEEAYNEFAGRFDSRNGGFGSAPKFPMAHSLQFLLRYHSRTQNKNALDMVEKTLTEMRKGGIYDRIGGGFHRYSTDAIWLVPHFEKMLYDQAQLVMAYVEAYQITGNSLYKSTAEEILNYVLWDMTSPGGGFYSAEDADSEGVEGKFYLWKKEEVERLLGEEDTRLFSVVYNVKSGGNWQDSIHGVMDTNILHLVKDIPAFADEPGIAAEALNAKLIDIRQRLFTEREKRVHPHKDDKVLTDWNGLMISAFALAAQAFDNNEYKGTAKKAADFILSRLVDKEGKLLHRYRDGDAAIDAGAGDYAFFIAALIDLYEATFEVEYLKKAVQLNDDFTARFWDSATEGFFFSADEAGELPARQKEIYDGAIPSSNSVAALNLLRLSRLTGNSNYEEIANRLFKAFYGQVSASPTAYTKMLAALDFAFGQSKEIVITAKQITDETLAVIRHFRAEFSPNKVIHLKTEENMRQLEAVAPYSKAMTLYNGNTAIYVCRDFQCSLPVFSIAEYKLLCAKVSQDTAKNTDALRI